MFDLTGMTALVTGASGGIGSAICHALAAQGAQLAVSGSNVEKLEAFRASLGGDHVAVPCNLGDKDSVEALVPAALEKLGKIDILVNNAGVTRDNLTMRMKDEEWDDVIRINLEATFRLMRAATKPMMKARFGRIITITSVVGTTGNPGQANYAASKGGVVGMTLPMARELSRFGIRVMTVAPGIFWTPMVDGMPPAVQESLAASIPFPPRLGKPDEYAALVRHIIENSMLNGEVIRLDGALRMAAK